MSTKDTEQKKYKVPTLVLWDIWRMHHWEGRSTDFIHNALLEEGTDVSKQRITKIIKTVEKWDATTFLKFGLQKKKNTKNPLMRGVANPIDMIPVGTQPNVWVPSAKSVPASITFEDKKIKHTIFDQIKLITAADCEYCTFAEQQGTYDKVLCSIKKKYGKKYQVLEVETIGNPIELFKDHEKRELAMFFITSMGEIPSVFDVFFPCLYIEGRSWGVMAQFRPGIHMKLLDKAVDLIHTRKLWPAPFAYLPPQFHTSKFVEVFGKGMKKGFRNIMQEVYS